LVNGDGPPQGGGGDDEEENQEDEEMEANGARARCPLNEHVYVCAGIVVLFVFLFYVLIGACFMPIIEDIDFITSVYTNVMSVTAVDFSIIVGGK
jgi:hypothetical protein